MEDKENQQKSDAKLQENNRDAKRDDRNSSKQETYVGDSKMDDRADDHHFKED
jgi:hypothetical protein